VEERGGGTEKERVPRHGGGNGGSKRHLLPGCLRNNITHA